MTGPVIVAEVGAAHNGSFERAMRLVEVASDAGADACKFQCWSEMALPGHIIADGPWKGRDLADLYAEAKTPWEWFPELFRYARHLGLEPFASVFDRESTDFMETLDCQWYKIASAEITDLDLIRYVASKNRPVIIGTGMATFDEVDAAASACQVGTPTLLKCVSAYPAVAADANLATIRNMRHINVWSAGLSDHTLGSAVACAATALGATMIEKHIGLDRTGPDGGFCTLPDDFARFVADVRDAAACMGEVRYGPTEAEASTLKLRRSLWVVRDVRAGDIVTRENVRSLRPAGGLLTVPEGAVFRCDVSAGSPLLAGMV